MANSEWRIASVHTTLQTLFAVRYSLFASFKGGAGRPGSRPVASDLIAWGAKNALLGRLRRPPGAWIGRPPTRRGLGGSTLPRSRLRAGAWAVYPPTGRRYRTAAPRLPIEAGVPATAILISEAGAMRAHR